MLADDCPAERAVYELESDEGRIEVSFLRARNLASYGAVRVARIFWPHDVVSAKRRKQHCGVDRPGRVLRLFGRFDDRQRKVDDTASLPSM